MAQKGNPSEWQDETGEFAVPRALVLSTIKEDLEEGKDKDESKRIKHNRVKTMLEQRTEQLSTAKGIMEVHPDLEMAKEIRVAHMLSPRDMSEYKLRLQIKKSIYAKASKPATLEAIVDILKEQLNLESGMRTIVGKALFTEGADIEMYLPPKTIEAVVAECGKLDLESFDNTPITELFPSLNNGYNFSESVTKDLEALGITEVSNNPKTLLRTEIRDHFLDRKIDGGFDVENANANTWFNVDKKSNSDGDLPLVFSEPEESDMREGFAIRKTLPTDAVLPLCDPSDPSKHFGYYLLTGENGHFLSASDDKSFMADLLDRLKKAVHDEQSTEFQIIKDVGIIDKEAEKKNKQDLDKIMQSWIDKVVDPIKRNITENGFNADEIKLKDNRAFYRIMLSRALRKAKTKIVFVPASMVSYVAFDYNQLGQGVSLLEKTAFYSSLRAILKIAGVMNSVTNAIPITDINVTLDEDDDDQLGTLETVMHEISKMTVMNFPVGSVNPSDIATSLQKASYRLKVDGGSKLPNTSTEISDNNRNKTGGMDSEILRQLKIDHYAGLGVAPEAIDQTLQGQFATGLVINDLMSARRSMSDQAILVPQIEDRIYKFCRWSPAIHKLLNDAKIKDLHSFCKSLSLIMPSADISRIEQQAEQYETVSRFIDEVMPSVIDDQVLRGIFGETNLRIAPNTLEDARNIIASTMKRKFIKDNNILPDIWALFDKDKESSLLTEMDDHYRSVFKYLGPRFKSILRSAANYDESMAKFIEENYPAEEGAEGAQPGDVPQTGGAIPFDEEGTPFAEPEAEEVPENLPEETPAGEGEEAPTEEPIDIPGTAGGEEEDPAAV